MTGFRAVLQRADTKFEAGAYPSAHDHYAEVISELLDKLDATRKTRKATKWVGWGAALLTGGIGLEDVVLVPLVNKGLQRMLGIDLEQMQAILLHASQRRLLILELSEQVLKAEDTQRVLLDYLLVIRLTVVLHDKGQLQNLLDVVNPLKEHTAVSGLGSKMSETDTMRLLVGEIAQASEAAESLGDHLFLYLLLRDKRNNFLYHTLRPGRESLEDAFDAPRRAASDSNSERERRYVALFGLNGKVTRDDIKRRFRELVLRYHPDRLQDAGEAALREAEAKTRQVIEAYAYLRQKYSIQ